MKSVMHVICIGRVMYMQHAILRSVQQHKKRAREKMKERHPTRGSFRDHCCTIGNVDTIKEFTDILVPYAANTLDGCSYMGDNCLRKVGDGIR
jgi:hypothetical protein